MWAHWRYQAIFTLSGLLYDPIAGLLIAMYYAKQFGNGLATGRLRDPAFPPGRRVILLGVWIGAILYAEVFFALGVITRNGLSRLLT